MAPAPMTQIRMTWLLWNDPGADHSAICSAAKTPRY
jgi:hypothetical protein